jgi:hypothetical protein
MKKAVHLFLVLILTLTLIPIKAQDAKQKGLDAITLQAVQGQLEFLSSDWTEGRATGTRGAYMAADYIASLFKIYGLKPGGDSKIIWPSRQERMAGKRPTMEDTYFQAFDLIEYKNGDRHEMSLTEQTSAGTRRMNFGYEVDFAVRASDVAVELDAPVVFAGYGIVDKENGYDDYKGVDVKGKIVMILAGYPGMDDGDSKAYKAFRSRFGTGGRSLQRHKSTQAAEHGVAGVIEVSPGSETPQTWASNLPFRYNTGNYEGDKPRASYYSTRMKHPGDGFSDSPVNISLSPRAAKEILKESGVDLETYGGSIKNSMKPSAKELTGKTLHLKTSVDSKLIRAQNVVGVLPGKDTTEIIVIGAHYDHLGIHDGWIWNGADDNASGTVGVMSIAKACMATGEKPEKTIVFCAWTGEEKGLLGSRYFADHPYDDAKMLLNLNYDMISRDDANDTLGIRCSMNYTKAYPVLKDLTQKNIEAYDLDLEVRFRPAERPRGGSDHSSFSAKDVPIMYFMAGFPPEYHQPEDHIDLVNFHKMTDIIRLGYLNIWDLANTEWGPAED